MLRPRMIIDIGEWQFTYGAEVDIEQDIETLTDTCRITIPRKHEWDAKKIAIGDDPILKLGDPVKVQLGYLPTYKTRFIGFIKDIKPGVPVTIECEDTMFLLKKGSITASYKDVSLQQLIDDIMPAGIEYKVISDKAVHIGQWRITNASPAKILEELKSKLKIYSYFRNITDNGITRPVLYVGLAYWLDHRNEHVFEFGENIIDDRDLIYKRKEDIKLKAKATSWLKNNTKIEVEVGDEDGEERTINAYNLTKEQLAVYAKAELERYKYTGWRGNFPTFGEPAAEKGDVAYLIGNKYHPDGKYLIKKLRATMNTSGYKQIIYPDSIINDKQNSTAS